MTSRTIVVTLAELPPTITSTSPGSTVRTIVRFQIASRDFERRHDGVVDLTALFFGRRYVSNCKTECEFVASDIERANCGGECFDIDAQHLVTRRMAVLIVY